MIQKTKSMYRKFFLVVIMLLFVVMVLDFSVAYQRSNPAYTKYSGFDSGGPYINYQDRCESGQDFVVQVAPFGCQPSVVRSDLLEEQNVPVFCQLSASKLNPMIDVKAIESMSFRGEYPEGVSGVGFHPAKAALGVDGNLNSPVLENIGYAVIVLEKEEVEDNMPDYVKGNLTARLKYDIENAFGVGRASFHLPELSESEWEDEKESYGFWNGRAYLRAEGVDSQGARIGVYEDTRKRASFELEKGESSRKVTIPSLDCLARFELKLEDLVNPDTRAKLNINGDVYHVGVGEKFLKNKCHVRDIEKLGLYQSVEISCSEDEKRSVFDLIQSPRIEIDVEEEKETVSLGERVEGLSSEDESVYVGYIGTIKETEQKRIFDSTDKEDLVVYFYKKDSGRDSLDASEVKSISRDIDSRVRSFDDIFSLGKRYEGLQYENSDGKRTSKNIYDKTVKIIDFAEPVDRGLSSYFDEGNDVYDTAKNYYDSATSDFEKILESYPSVENKNSGGEEKIMFGEEAFKEQIKMEAFIGNKRTAAELCRKFSDRYPDSELYSGEVKNICENNRILSGSEISKRGVFIDNQLEVIALDRIKEPRIEEYGIEVRVRYPNGDYERYTLGKDQKIYLNQTKGDFIQLASIENSTHVKLNVELESSGEDTDNIEGDKKLTTNKQRSFGSEYDISLLNVNLEKLAKVSVNPTIDNQYTESNFSFQISIEKRSINLSPEKTKERIKNLNESIKDWSEKNEKLGNVVEGLKKSCLAVGGFLTLKNLLSGTDGEAIARKKVMRDEGGWNDYCSKKVGDGEYYSMNDCFNKNSGEIDGDVEEYKRTMNEQNLEKYSEGAEVETPFLRKFLGEKTIDDEKYMENYAPDAQKTLENSGITSINCGEDVKIDDDIIQDINFDSWKEGSYNKDDLRELQFYSMIYQKDNSDERAKQRICDIYGDMQTNLKADEEKREAEKEIKDKEAISGLDFSVLRNEDTVTKTYSGRKVGEGGIEELEEGEQAEGIVYNGKNYIVTISKDVSSSGLSTVKEVYNTGGDCLSCNPSRLTEDEKENIKQIQERLVFEKGNAEGYSYDYESSGSAPSKGPLVKFYEREPYEGMPAIVPFDKKNGWYAAIKQTLPGLGNIGSYEESGRVSSFYLCNVYKNNREDNMKGDDKCHMINLGTGQPYQMASFGSERESRKLVEDAVKAIEQASRQRQENPSLTSVRIDTSRGRYNFEVGEPQVNIPDVQCQDFMSPSDCNLLFNICDPVVCPSSRCDFGGAYPVRDVIQSGIAGSLFLCLPNIQEDIYMPVCLSGVHAGLDGYISILKSHRDCLQESLDTGKMIGICDEIYSVHLCDFFWRQTLPLAKMAVPKLLETVAGNNVRGGGEYMNVQEAWDNAEQSVDYFSDYYSADAYEAFETRATEAIKESVCKNYVSANYPDEGNLADSLTNPDSPPQFHGRFDENSFTTTTNPPVSHYKVYYHIYAGKDSRAYYQVYLKGDESSFYRDTSLRRNVASGYIPKGEYASETKDFTAPSGYKKLCINVNGQEECEFKQVSTSAGVNYVKDKYLEEQAGEKDIRSESECISGSPSLYNAINLNPQSMAEESVDPAIYNRGLTRVCASENPGKGSDSGMETEEQRWVDVGYCDDEDMRCWLDTESVEDNIDYGNIENRTLSDLTNHTLQKLRDEGGYPTKDKIDSLLKEAKDTDEDEEGLKERISKIDKFIDKIFWNEQKADALIERGKAYAKLLKLLIPDSGKGKETSEKDIKRNTECANFCDDKGYEEGISVTNYQSSELGDVSKSEEIDGCFCYSLLDETTTEDDSDEDTSDDTSDEDEGCDRNPSCQSASAPGAIAMGGDTCLTKVGNKVKLIAGEIKKERIDEADFSDSFVKENTGAESFECLVLQLAMQESCLSHCDYKEKESDPFYCEGNSDSVLKGDNGNSIGIMQINKNVHSGDFSDFSDNVAKGVNLLIDNYNSEKKPYKCIKNQAGEYQTVTYSGWERALRAYNGWNTRCEDDENIIGDPEYVKNVEDKKEEVAKYFSECSF